MPTYVILGQFTDQGVRNDVEPVRGTGPYSVDLHGCDGIVARRIDDVGLSRAGDHARDDAAALRQARYRPGDSAADRDLPQFRATDQQFRVHVGALPSQVDPRQFDGRSARPRDRGPRRPRRCRRCGGGGRT